VNQPSWQRVKDIFADASGRPEPEQTQWVRQAAQGDAEIETEVLRLLRLDDGASERLADLKPPAEMTQYAIEQHAFCSGDVLAARYEIQRFIAFGGMGEVYEAEDQELGQRIAIKALRSELAREDHLLWVKREVQAARRVQHPNVCRVFDLVQTQTPSRDSVVFLTMELLEGETLSEKLRREGPLSERQAFPLIRQMVAALSAAHQAGVVHRDLKTGNVLLVPRAGGAPRVVITDFGLARQVPSDRRATVTKWSPGSMEGYGTPAYMAPEQIQSGRVGPAADVYAFGVVLYEMLTGDLPYPEDSPLAMAVKKTRERPLAPERLTPALRPTWSAAILRCLEADPKRRFSDVREVLTHLETRSRGRLWWRLLRRRHRGKLKLAAASTGLAAVAAIAWWLWPPEPRSEAVVDWERGVFDLQAGEPAQAARRLERALAHHRLPVVAHAYLALAWHELGFDDRARSELNRARYKPLQSERDRRFERAVALQLAGQREEARGLLERHPADLALLEDQLGRPEAEAHWKQVVIKSPNHPAAHLRLAMIYAKKGRWKEADREFILAETYFQAGDDPEMVRAVSARRGFARMQNGDADLARHDLSSIAGFLPRPAGSGYGACERTVTVMAGEADNFALPYDPIPYVNPEFAAHSMWPKDGRLKQFDELRDDASLYVSLILPPLRFCGGQLEFRIRKGRSGWENDSVNYGIASNLSKKTLIWDRADTTERLLRLDLDPAFLLDVQRAQIGKRITSLDIIIGDDTIVDYVKITLVY
jgi:tetratricopeptide (TPR) repeat protein